MKIYILITSSILLYPIVGYFLLRLTRGFPKIQNSIVRMFGIISTLTILGFVLHLITIYEDLNWFLLSSIYFTICISLWFTQYQTNLIVKNIGAISMSILLGVTYFVAIFLFFFVLIFSIQLGTIERKWVTSNILYLDRNIGFGSESFRKVEIYKKIELMPIFAYRIQSKTYVEEIVSHLGILNVSFSEKNQTLNLSKAVNESNDYNFNDTIYLNDKH